MNFKDLQKEWYDKLEESGFVDIEKNGFRSCQSSNINPHLKTSKYGLADLEGWYRAIGIYAHNNAKLKQKYKDALLLLNEGYTHIEIEAILKDVTHHGLSKFLERNKKKIVNFVHEMEKDDE